jgi:hypothetical protein
MARAAMRSPIWIAVPAFVSLSINRSISEPENRMEISEGRP